jgi:hypothetical protein
LFKYSLKLAPYKKCLELTTNVDPIVIIEDAPPDSNCKKTIWDAPPKIINEVAKVSMGENPSSIPIAPKIIPNGTTGISKGSTSKEPLKKSLDLII